MILIDCRLVVFFEFVDDLVCVVLSWGVGVVGVCLDWDLVFVGVCLVGVFFWNSCLVVGWFVICGLGIVVFVFWVLVILFVLGL